MKSLSQTLITGVYRTGSQYFVRILNAHPELSSTEYKVNVMRFIYKRYDPFENNYLRALEDTAHRMKKRYNEDLDSIGIKTKLLEYAKVDVGIFYDEIMTSLYLEGNKKHWAEKSQLEWRNIPNFIKMMPNGKAIHIIRDPRSILLSFKKNTIAPPPLFLGAIWNCYDSMKHSLKYMQDTEISKKYQTITYEAYALNPQGMAQRTWNFLGLSPGDFDVHDQSGWVTEKGEKWYINSSFQKNVPEKFDVNKSIHRWKKYLNQDEIILTEGICGELMEKFGYVRTISGLTSQMVEDALNRLAGDHEKIHHYYKIYKEFGEGIQEYPLNPLDASTWR